MKDKKLTLLKLFQSKPQRKKKQNKNTKKIFKKTH